MGSDKPDYGYVLMPASPTAQCPFCGRTVRLANSNGIGIMSGQCAHAEGAEAIEGQQYVRFIECA